MGKRISAKRSGRRERRISILKKAIMEVAMGGGENERAETVCIFGSPTRKAFRNISNGEKWPSFRWKRAFETRFPMVSCRDPIM